jgi:hypothetical protein
MDGQPDQRQGAEEGHLIPPDHHHGGAEREQHAITVGAAVQGLLQEPEGQGKEPIAEDHARMLKPRRGRAAEHEDQSRDHGACRMPSPPAEQGHEGQSAGEKMSEDDHVEELHGGFGNEPSEQQHGGGEQQGLRIRRGRVAAEMIGIPQGEFPMGEGVPQVAQGRIELVLGVPGNDGPRQGPDGSGNRPGRKDERKRDQRLALRPLGRRRGIIGSEKGCLHGPQAVSRLLNSPPDDPEAWLSHAAGSATG